MYLLIFLLFFVVHLYIIIFLAVYLCKKETEKNFHGDLLNYEVENIAKAKVDLNKWKFEFLPSQYNSNTYNTSDVMLLNLF